MDNHGLYIHGYPWIAMDYPWIIHRGGERRGLGRGGEVKMFTFVSDLREFPGQLGGAPGSVKDYFKLDC